MPNLCQWFESGLKRLHSRGPKSSQMSAHCQFMLLFLRWMIERQLEAQLMGGKELYAAQQILRNWVCAHKEKSFTGSPSKILAGLKCLVYRLVLMI